MDASDVPIPEPCSADWDDMSGDERKRFCALCNKHVHDLSAMDEAAAREVVEQPDVCVRYTVDARDRIQFRSRRRFLVRSVMAAGALMSVPAAASVAREASEEGLLSWARDALSTWWDGGCSLTEDTRTVSGGLGPAPTTTPAEEGEESLEEPIQEPERLEDPEPPRPVMGRMPVKPRKTMGKPAPPRPPVEER